MEEINIPSTNKPRVIIIGGGFAGIKLIRQLKGKGFQIILFDRHNYHTFQPLLYQVATAGLEPDSIAGPLRKLTESYKDFYFRMATVSEILTEKQMVMTDLGEISYDYLVIANGSVTNYFDNENIMKYAFPLKQIPQALDLRSHILQNFEKAVISSDKEEIKTLLTFIIVGGGPTGVETSGALGELKKHVLPHDYPELDLSLMSIHLLEGNRRLLAGMSEESSNKALKYLERFDVDVQLNTRVTDYNGHEAILQNGKVIKGNTLLWAAGVKGNLLSGIPEGAVERGRILVDQFNRIRGFNNIFAIGDIALMKTEDYPTGHPMVAQVAIQQGKHLANNLVNLVKTGNLKIFQYRDKGSMATIGRNRAVVDLPAKISFGGLLAWFAWMFVHLIAIIGFRNKLVVFSNWVWNYFTYDRGTRLIIRPFKPNYMVTVPKK